MRLGTTPRYPLLAACGPCYHLETPRICHPALSPDPLNVTDAISYRCPKQHGQVVDPVHGEKRVLEEARREAGTYDWYGMRRRPGRASTCCSKRTARCPTSFTRQRSITKDANADAYRPRRNSTHRERSRLSTFLRKHGEWPRLSDARLDKAKALRYMFTMWRACREYRMFDWWKTGSVAGQDGFHETPARMGRGQDQRFRWRGRNDLRYAERICATSQEMRLELFRAGFGGVQRRPTAFELAPAACRIVAPVDGYIAPRS
jgi:hypothetical protein